MTRLANRTRVSRDEILAWAYDPDPALPENADGNIWDLMLLDWHADIPLYVDIAADDNCPKRYYFLRLLCQGLRSKCARTTWLSKDPVGVLQGFSPSHPRLVGRKGRGKKEKDRLRERLTHAVHQEAALPIRAEAKPTEPPPRRAFLARIRA